MKTQIDKRNLMVISTLGCFHDLLAWCSGNLILSDSTPLGSKSDLRYSPLEVHEHRISKFQEAIGGFDRHSDLNNHRELRLLLEDGCGVFSGAKQPKVLGLVGPMQ